MEHTLLVERYSTAALSFNMASLQTQRLCTAIVAGLVAGILGIHGWFAGLAFYTAAIQLNTIANYWHSRRYFPSLYSLATEGFQTGLMTFILLWTLFYNTVHVYY